MVKGSDFVHCQRTLSEREKEKGESQLVLRGREIELVNCVYFSVG